MILLKNIEAFEKEVTMIELDFVDKIDELSREKEVCRYMAASKYANCGESVTFIDTIKPTYKAQLDAMIVSVYQDALMMNLSEIEGVWKRVLFLKIFLDKEYDKVSEHFMKRKEYNSNDFFNDVLKNFTLETKGFNEDLYSDKTLVGHIFNAIFDRSLAIDDLIKILEDLWKEKGGVVNKSDESKRDTDEQRGFYMGLTESQLKKLHQQLIDDNFIKCTDTDFINAFSGRQIVNKLEWIDKAERVKYVTIQTLFQLLHSCNIELSDKNKVIKKEVKETLNSIFSNSWGNITSKFNEFNPLTTNRQKTISSMINNLKS